MMHGRTMAAGWLAVVLAGTCAWGAQVENVRAQQRARSRVVDVWYDLVAPEGGVYEVSLAIGGEEELPISTVAGDWGADIEPGRNKRIEWDAGTDWPGRVGSNFVATVAATKLEAEDTGPSKGMVRIPGGTNSGHDPDYGSYSLTVEPFYMDKTEVTYTHWKRVYNWAVAHGYEFDYAGSGKGANHPVHSLTWFDCARWCNARSEMEGRTPAYWSNGQVYRTGQANVSVNLDGAGYRLPTSAEWEYAARGGKHGRRFPWGNKISPSRANYYSNTNISYDLSSTTGFNPHYAHGEYPYTSAVGSFSANGYGLYDMVGNVWEWTSSLGGGWGRVRGGSWGRNASHCRLGSDGGSAGEGDGSGSNEYFGFRAVRRR